MGTGKARWDRQGGNQADTVHRGVMGHQGEEDTGHKAEGTDLRRAHTVHPGLGIHRAWPEGTARRPRRTQMQSAS